MGKLSGIENRDITSDSTLYFHLNACFLLFAFVGCGNRREGTGTSWTNNHGIKGRNLMVEEKFEVEIGTE